VIGGCQRVASDEMREAQSKMPVYPLYSSM